MYASPALSLNYKEVNEFNVCWNSVIRRIFGYQRSESVKDVMNRYALGGLNVKHLLLLRRVKFYYHLYRRTDLLHNLFWASLLSNSTHDECMISVFSPLYIAIDSVHATFYEYVHGCITLPVFSGE